MKGWWGLIVLAGLSMHVVCQASDANTKIVRLDADADQVAIESYMAATGAPANVAKVELSRQLLAYEAVEALRREFAGRLAGLYWTSYPNQAVNVRLLGTSAVAPRKIETAAGPVSVIFKVGVSDTDAERQIKLKAAFPALRSMLPGFYGAGIDGITGEAIIDVRSPGGDARPYTAEKANIERVLGMPVRINVTPYETGSFEHNGEPPAGLAAIGDAQATYVVGGSKLSSGSQYCTGGFTVRDPISGKRGILTAGHCPESLIYENYPVPPNTLPTVLIPATFQKRWWGGENDFQWHTFPDGISVSYSYCRSYSLCDGVVIINGLFPSVGATMCHMGVTTGASCGTLKTDYYEYDETLCSNADPQTCPTGYWLRVVGPNLACSYGDSGGPVYFNNVAYGLAKGAAFTGVAKGQCSSLIVMPIRRVRDAGLIVL